MSEQSERNSQSKVPVVHVLNTALATLRCTDEFAEVFGKYPRAGQALTMAICHQIDAWLMDGTLKLGQRT